MSDIFSKLSHRIAETSGHAWSFIFALLIILIWVLSGPMFNYSTDWQLVVNTVTSIVTFLMVFLIQGVQNRETKAIQLKLDELIRVTHAARNTLLDLEELSDNELDKLEASFRELSRKRSRVSA